MSDELGAKDLYVILESLKYSKQRIQDYPDHPSYEFKQEQLKPIDEAMRKVRSLQKEMENR
jgi:hypothetical protein